MTFMTSKKIKGEVVVKASFSLCLFLTVLIVTTPFSFLGSSTINAHAGSVQTVTGSDSSSAISALNGTQGNTVSNSQGSNTPSKIPASFKEPTVYAQYAILMDSATGQVLYKKNEKTRAFPASITKIMTGLLTVENLKPEDIITMSHKAVYSIERDSSHIALQEGEEITMEQAIRAILLVSANDAANGAAERVAGSLENFATLMNSRAKAIGALDTQFMNAHGLPDDNHYTTAYDMALITRVAISNPVFKAYFSETEYTMQPTNKQKESRYFLTHDKMLYNTKYRYKDAFAGKTGYTTKAGSTLVTVGKRDGHELICVTLKESAPEAYYDAKALLEFGFTQFEPVQLSSSRFTATPIKIIENNQLIGKASIDDSQERAIWVPKGSSITPEMILLDTPESMDSSTKDKTKIVLNAYVPALISPFYESAIKIPLQTVITLTPAATPTPALTVSNNSGKMVFTVLKYIAGSLIILVIIYLLYVVLMIFRLGYYKKLWKKIKKKFKKAKKKHIRIKSRQSDNNNTDMVRKIVTPEE